jgi:predicted phosphodiesterase
MRHAVFSDVHANLPALEAALESAEEEGVDDFLFAGDTVGYGAHPNECIDLVRRYGRSVMGNHDHTISSPDRYFDKNEGAQAALELTRKVIRGRNLRFLQGLPTHLSTGNLFIVHGSPEAPLSEYVFEDDDAEKFDANIKRFFGVVHEPILVMGHTHQPFVRSVGGKLIVNPGSVGQPRDHDPRASYAIIDDRAMTAEIVRVPYATREVYASFLKAGLPEHLGLRLCQGI